MTTPFLKRSPNGIYHYRRDIPKSLRPVLGLREIKQSLGRDFESAMKKYAEVHQKADKAIADAKLSPSPDDARSQVLSVLNRHRITPQELAEVPYADDEGQPLAPHIHAIIDELIEEYEKAERNGKQARISVEAIRALSAGRIPKETHTIASALEFYRKRRAGKDATKDKARGEPHQQSQAAHGVRPEQPHGHQEGPWLCHARRGPPRSGSSDP